MIYNFYFLDINIFKSYSIYIPNKKHFYSWNLRLILLFIVIFYLKITDLNTKESLINILNFEKSSLLFLIKYELEFVLLIIKKPRLVSSTFNTH